LTAAFVFAGLLAILCVLLVAWPFLREPEPESDSLDELDDAERRRLELLEEDYRAQVGLLRRDAATALRDLERAEAVPAPGGEQGRPVGGRT